MSGDTSFEEYSKGLTSPADVHTLIAAGGTASYTYKTAPRGFYVNSSGTAVIDDSEGTEVTYNVIVGQIIPIRPYAVKATSTADLIMLW
jgi:hypothetical protein